MTLLSTASRERTVADTSGHTRAKVVTTARRALRTVHFISVEPLHRYGAHACRGQPRMHHRASPFETMSLDSLLPWDPLPLLAFVCAGVLLAYARGIARGERPGVGRACAFVAGVALVYAATQTRLDYYAQFLFSAHRAQHAVLHHLAPFLIAWSAPGGVLAAGLGGTRAGPAPPWLAPVRRAYRGLQTPWLAGVLFVGLIALWLMPPVHFLAMLDRRLYWTMNLGMVVDGLLFWWLVLARHSGGWTPCLPLGPRLLLVVGIVPPQVMIGAGIALAERPLFDIYDLCGRALPLGAMADQHIGGLLTWLPAVMMSLLATLVLVARQLDPTRGRHAPALADTVPR